MGSVVAYLQCPFCRQYTLDVFPRLVRDYVRTGKLRVEFRNLSFIGPDSERAARVAAAAGLQDKLWNVIDVVYLNQGRENSGYVTDAFLRRVVGAVPGLDADRTLADRNSAVVAAQLQAADTLARRRGVAATPWFLIGRTGGPLSALPARQLTAAPFTAAIDRLLKA